jgi:hypothetical protein
MLGWFRDRWQLPRTSDARPYFEASVLFQARDMAQAEFLFDAMIDGLGCGTLCGDERPCPHFRVAGLHQVDDE